MASRPTDHDSFVRTGVADVSLSRMPGLSRQLLILTAGVWLTSFALSTVRDLAAPPPGFAAMTAIRLAFAFVAAGLCAPLQWLLVRLNGRSFAVRVLAVLPAVALTAMIYTEGTLIAQQLYGTAPATTGGAWRFYNTVYWAMFFVAWVALNLALTYSHESVVQAARARASDALSHDTHLRALRYQVDPHFLFNALNSVSSLVVTGRTEAAEAMLSRLSRYFRASLAIDPLATIALSEEIALQRRYLEIEQVRFPDLEVIVDLSPEASGAAVPALLLQPIIENAVKHGVANRDAPTRIVVTGRVIGAVLELRVENDAVPAARNNDAGAGLAITRSRLTALYGASAIVTADAVPGGFRVDLHLPVEPA